MKPWTPTIIVIPPFIPCSIAVQYQRTSNPFDMEIEVRLLGGLKDHHVPHVAIKHQPKLIQAQLPPFSGSECNGCAPPVISCIAMGFCRCTEVDHKIAERPSWRWLLQRKKLAKYFN